MKLDARVVYEGFGRRLLAGLIDLAFVVLFVLTLVLLRQAIEESPPPASAVLSGLAALWPGGLWLLALIFLAQTLFWAWFSATPGMLLLGCQVLRAANGAPISLPESVLRGVGLWLGLACLGLGALWSIWDPRHRGVHDILAGTVVVKEDESLMTLDELLRGIE